MTEETSCVSTEAETMTSEAPSARGNEPPKPVPTASPQVASATRHEVREAEHKLKEMSRKAKERKTAQNASKHPKGLSEINYFWLVIGGLGALGVGYLVFGKKDSAAKPRQRFKFVPPPEKPPEQVNEQVEREDSVSTRRGESTPKFELNCF